MQGPSRSWPVCQRIPTRLSLRALMLGILAFACGLGWVVRRAHVQRDAVAAIERAGGRVRYDWQFKDGTIVRNGKPRGPKWLVRLLGVHYFDHVTMVNASTPLTDMELAQVGNLTSVDTLILNPSKLFDSGLADLDRLRNLRWLTMTSPFGSPDTRIIPLKMLARLKGLNLDRTDVTDAGLKSLVGKNDLELLGLTQTGITDAGLVHLAGLVNLQHLYLDGTQVSDEGLARLKQLANLKGLHVKSTKITDAGLKEFRQAKPQVRVSH